MKMIKNEKSYESLLKTETTVFGDVRIHMISCI